jgi:hypothetical protein
MPALDFNTRAEYREVLACGLPESRMRGTSYLEKR